ncbi:trypsin-like serine peptidase [Streptomyces sp. NPDC059649]|uniref:trypsin-like serine peptidase n=1 Tax=Streptomyces sp. NPDC059649 TaxID=3346895 RepID=UPI00367A51AB
MARHARRRAAVPLRTPLLTRGGRAVTAALGMAVCLAAAPAVHAAERVRGGAAVDDRPTQSAGRPTKAPGRPTKAPDAPWTSRDAAAYWTPERMAAAAPAENDTPGGTGSASASASASAYASASSSASGAKSSGAAARLPATARHFDGIPSVGVLFSVDGDARAHHCTASVVRSPHRNLILTAGHCNPGDHAAFVPEYRSGAQTQPYGVWAIDESFAYPERGTTGDSSDLDFAFATVEADADGRALEDVTGGNVLAPTPGYTNDVTVIGYPAVRNDPEDRAVRCAARTSRLAGTSQLRMECGGFFGGTSGSPWLAGFDERTGTGRVIGLIGGLNGGGPKGPNSDRVSYSPYFGAKILSLYARATKA